MNGFKAYLKKEIIESFRQYKYLIIGISILFFAILDPIMLKLLPTILKSQTKMDLSSLYVINKNMAFQNYIKDLFQLVNIIIIFTLSGIISKEFTDQKLVFPYSKGINPSSIVFAKALHYIIFITSATFLGFAVSFYYVSILFKGKGASFEGVMASALCISLFFAFNIILLEFINSITKKSMLSGIAVLFLNYFFLIFKSFTKFYNFLPIKFIDIANTFNLTGINKPLISIVIFSLILLFLTIYRMKNVDVISSDS